jgi:hypothetical protein
MELDMDALNDELSAHAEAVIRSGQHPTMGDYVAALIQKDKERVEAAAWLQRVHDEAVASGPPVETTPGEIRDRMLRQIEEVRLAMDRRAR